MCVKLYAFDKGSSSTSLYLAFLADDELVKIVHSFSKHLLSTTHVIDRLPRRVKRAPALEELTVLWDGGLITKSKLNAWFFNRRVHRTCGSCQLTL